MTDSAGVIGLPCTVYSVFESHYAPARLSSSFFSRMDAADGLSNLNVGVALLLEFYNLLISSELCIGAMGTSHHSGSGWHSVDLGYFSFHEATCIWS